MRLRRQLPSTITMPLSTWHASTLNRRWLAVETGHSRSSCSSVSLNGSLIQVAFRTSNLSETLTLLTPNPCGMTEATVYGGMAEIFFRLIESATIHSCEDGLIRVEESSCDA